MDATENLAIDQATCTEGWVPLAKASGVTNDDAACVPQNLSDFAQADWEFIQVPPILSERMEGSFSDEGSENDGGSENDARQRCEALAMAGMYGKGFQELSQNEWVFRTDIAKGVFGEMWLSLPVDYPWHSAPTLTLCIPGCRDLQEICKDFMQDFVPGNEVAFAWSERFQQLCKTSAEALQALTASKKAERDARLGLAKDAKPASNATSEPADSRWCSVVRETRDGYRDEYRYWDACKGPTRSFIVAENKRMQRQVDSKKMEQEVKEAKARRKELWKTRSGRWHC